MSHAIPNNQPSNIIIWEPSSLSYAQIQSYEYKDGRSEFMIARLGTRPRFSHHSVILYPYARSVSPVSYTPSTSIPVLLPRPVLCLAANRLSPV